MLSDLPAVHAVVCAWRRSATARSHTEAQLLHRAPQEPGERSRRPRVDRLPALCPPDRLPRDVGLAGELLLRQAQAAPLGTNRTTVGHATPPRPVGTGQVRTTRECTALAASWK